MLKAQAGARQGQAVRRGRKTGRRRGNKIGEKAREKDGKLREAIRMTGRRFPGFSFCSKHPKLDCEQRGASAQRHASQPIPTTLFPTVGAFFKTRKTFLRLHVRQTQNRIPRQVNAQACAKPRSKSRRFPLGIACFFLLRQSLSAARLPVSEICNAIPSANSDAFSPAPPPTELPTAPALCVSPWTSLLSPWRPAFATSRLRKDTLYSLRNCITSIAFNGGSESRLLMPVGAGDIFLSQVPQLPVCARHAVQPLRNLYDGGCV